MLKTICSILFMALTLTTQVWAQVTSKDQIETLLKSMSIEEKVGQMTQVNIDLIYDKDNDKIDPAKLKECIEKYKIGSILNSPGGAISIDEWHELLKTVQKQALKTKSKIPVLYGVDAIHGVTYTKNATLFPHNIALGATRNKNNAFQAARITALETRASGLRWNFDPVLDIGRNPIWPRFPETFGEDSYIISEMGEAMIKAYEQDNLKSEKNVASCMKHYVGYSDPASGKDRTPAFIPNVILWEHYLPQFKRAIDAGASTIMINSASVNGMPVHASKELLSDILRDSLGFKGLIVTDWEDIIRLHERHNVASTPKEAVKMAIEAGIDMSMVPSNYSFFEYLVELVKEGTISEDRINKSVRIILNLKQDLGLFDNPFPEKEAKANFGLPTYQTAALQSAQEAMTLLKNKGDILPLDKKQKVLIAGPTGNSLAPLNGSWSFTWQGKDESKYPESYITVAEAISNKIGKENIINISQNTFDDASNFDRQALIQKSTLVDVIILCLGENAYAESPGSIDDLNLPQNQKDLALAAYSTGKPVILILNEGRPRIINEIVPGADGILMAYQSGSKAAEAIADVIFGDYNPGGILPFTYPRFTGDIVMYDRLTLSDIQRRSVGEVIANGYYPQWEFGYGLSYTTFDISELKLSSYELSRDDTLTVSFTIKNTGEMDGSKSLDLYLSDLYASLSPSVKKLKRFTRVFLKAEESTTVNFKLTIEDLEFYNLNLNRVAEPGEFKITIANREAKFKLL